MLWQLMAITISAALIAASAQAATLTNIEGAVTVSQGSGFQQAVAGAQVAPGDRIRTKSGSAEILYPNGCAVRVGPKQLVTVLASPPPCPASGGGLKDGPVAAAAPGDGTFLIGGLMIASGIGIGIAVSNNNNSPASP